MDELKHPLLSSRHFSPQGRGGSPSPWRGRSRRSRGWGIPEGRTKSPIPKLRSDLSLKARVKNYFAAFNNAATRPAVDEFMPLGAFLALDDRQQPGRQFLAEFDAPLVEGVDVEERAFDEDAVLVERDQAAEA